MIYVSLVHPSSAVPFHPCRRLSNFISFFVSVSFSIVVILHSPSFFSYLISLFKLLQVHLHRDFAFEFFERCRRIRPPPHSSLNIQVATRSLMTSIDETIENRVAKRPHPLSSLQAVFISLTIVDCESFVLYLLMYEKASQKILTFNRPAVSSIHRDPATSIVAVNQAVTSSCQSIEHAFDLDAR